jgi:hypothetical protein
MVLVEPEGEIGLPQLRKISIKITLDEALRLSNKTDFMCIHRLTR